MSVDGAVRGATGQVLDLVLRASAPIVICDSPPGAGKSRLATSVVALAQQLRGWRVALVAPRASQIHDLVRRLLRDFEELPIQILKAADRVLPDDLATEGRLLPVAIRPGELAEGSIVVAATAAKLFVSRPALEPRSFDLLCCDEAYQLAYKDVAPLLSIARCVLLIGDPGQLAPLVRVPTARYEAAAHKIHHAAPQEIRRKWPGVPVVALPASFRLPPDTVAIVQPAFYPQLPFVSGAQEQERRILFARPGADTGVDRGLDLLAGGASIIGLLLPAAPFPIPGIDAEVAQLAARVAARVLVRGAAWAGQRDLRAADLGILDAHVASGAAIRAELRRAGIGAELRADTPEIWQGLESPFVIAAHPCGGAGRLSAFQLDPGRMCVMMSRHLLACVIVGRADIGDKLRAHSHACGERPIGAENLEWRGWRAHERIWQALEVDGRLIRVDPAELLR